jgi:pyruvate formate lyase activating enzyme
MLKAWDEIQEMQVLSACFLPNRNKLVGQNKVLKAFMTPTLADGQEVSMSVQAIDYVATKYWHKLEDGRVQCDVCPRECKLKEGQQGLCFVRGRQKDQVVLSSYGRSSGFCVDPVEKKPLNHFLPGTPVFSFGTAGCNLSCKYCQNWDMSKSREMDILAAQASPGQIAIKAQQLGCRSVAFTYNDPVIFLEYAVDTARACHERDIKTVAVTAGYISPGAREDFFAHIDAANVDLKGFSENFYRKLTGGHLQPVLDTLTYLKHETSVWLELTTLLIPGHNDSDDEIKRMTEWVVKELGTDVPMHFTAFHPDWKMLDLPATSPDSLTRARQIALDNGVHYAYTGNVHDQRGESTYCHQCGELLIERDWYVLGHWGLDDKGCCGKCGTKLAGVLESMPGNWGARRMPIAM